MKRNRLWIKKKRNMDKAIAAWHWVTGVIVNPLSTLGIGGFLGVYLTIFFNRPRLVLLGQGSGSTTSDTYYWAVNVANRPTFFGIPLSGETALDLTVSVTLDVAGGAGHMLFWPDRTDDHRITLGPGIDRELRIFYWFRGTDGYCVVDGQQNAVSCYRDREASFVLRFDDRFNRTRVIPFKVTYDGSRLNAAPNLQLQFPRTLADRVEDLRNACSAFRNAFR